jgi:hypothetical protein
MTSHIAFVTERTLKVRVMRLLWLDKPDYLVCKPTWAAGLILSSKPLATKGLQRLICSPVLSYAYGVLQFVWKHPLLATSRGTALPTAPSQHF